MGNFAEPYNSICSIMKRFYFLLAIISLTLFSQAQVTEFPFIEGFEGSVFPPADWLGYPLTGQRVFERVTEGEYPDCSPHDGSMAMAQYNSFSAQAGNAAVLISPALALADDNIVRFWFFRSEDPSNNRRDKIEIYYNATPDLEGAILLDSVNRAVNFYPEVPFEDWYQYSFEFNRTGDTYLIFKVISAYGWTMYLDDIEVDDSTIDDAAPLVISLDGTQVYAQQEMHLQLRVRDNTGMPENITGELTIDGVITEVNMIKTSGTQGDFFFEGSISGQPNHTAGEIRFWLIDDLGNAAWSDTYSLHWDWIQPILEEGFEGEVFPPANWTVTGMPLTWLQWDDYGLVYYTDSDEVEYLVYPPEGNRQAAVEWDFQGNVQDEWLISPIVNIEQDEVLTFKTFARLYSYDYDEYMVNISTNGFTWNTVWSAADYPPGVTDYNEDISISLTDYVGSDIRIAWRAYNAMGSNLWYSWFVDDVKIRAVDTLVGIVPMQKPILSQAKPNPFTGNTCINFHQEKPGSGSLILTSTEGKIIIEKKYAYLPAGNQEIIIDGTTLLPGFYIYKLITADGVASGRLVRR